MSTSEVNVVIRAVDEASDKIKAVTGTVQHSMNKIEASTESVHKVNGKMVKDAVVGFSGVATSAFALYNAIDRVQDMQVSVNRANIAAKSALNAVDDAQRRYNATLEKYGVDSEQAKAAAADLTLAQERYQVATERADMMQGNLNQAMVQSALTIIPTMITMVSSLSQATQAFTAIQKVFNMVMAANPILLVVAAVAALVAALIWAYENVEPFRNAVNAVGKALYDFFKPAIEAISGALNWLWQNILEPLGKFLSAMFIVYIQTLGTVLAWLNENVVQPLGNALKWLWENILKAVFWYIENIAVPVVKMLIGAFEWLWQNILKPIADFISNVLLPAIKPLTDVLGAVGGALSAIGKAIFGSPRTIFEDAADGVKKLQRSLRGLDLPSLSGEFGFGFRAVSVNVDARGSTFTSDYDADALMDRVIWRLRRENAM